MKKMNIKYFIAGMAVVLTAAACESNIPEAGTMDVDAENIVLADELVNGLEIYIGQTVELEDLVTVLPENATDRAQTYLSSDENVAAVTAQGVLTAVGKGDCTIDVYVGSKGLYASFDVNVDDVPPVAITSLQFRSETAEFEFEEDGQTIDLMTYLTVVPIEHTEGVKFISSNTEVASVDANTGLLTIHKIGKTTITATAEDNTQLTDEMEVGIFTWDIDEYERFEGDAEGGQAAISGENWYWTMTFSDELLTASEQKLINGRNNSLTAMIDGRAIVNRSGSDDAELSNGTAFCVKAKNTAADHVAYFTIDMGKQQKVNYFRISNISTFKDDVRVRFKKFTEISGSNDGTNFTPIETEFDFSSIQSVLENRNTGNLEIHECEYRYMRFSFKGTECFGPDALGSTAQIEEFYMGYQEKNFGE